MKLYLTLEDDDGDKVERLLVLGGGLDIELSTLVSDMLDSLEKSKKPL